MLTLTYGRKKPQTGDKGAAFYPALADNAAIDDAHAHDGADSARVEAKNLSKGSVSVGATGWSSSGGLYRKLVTLPAGYVFGTVALRFFLSGGTDDGQECFPQTEKVTTTTFYVYMPMNNQALTVLCG